MHLNLAAALSTTTYQNIVATRIPMPIQSTNTTQIRNLMKCTAVRPNTTVNPREETAMTSVRCTWGVSKVSNTMQRLNREIFSEDIMCVIVLTLGLQWMVSSDF